MDGWSASRLGHSTVSERVPRMCSEHDRLSKNDQLLVQCSLSLFSGVFVRRSDFGLRQCLNCMYVRCVLFGFIN